MDDIAARLSAIIIPGLAMLLSYLAGHAVIRLIKLDKPRIKLWLPIIFMILFTKPISSLFLGSNLNVELFGPSNQKECIQKYVKKTQTDFAASLVTSNCSRLFSSDTKYTYSATDEKTGKPIRFNSETQDWELTPSEEATHELNVQHARKVKEKALCVLKLDDLYEAKTDKAAMIILSNSSCW